MRTRTPSGYRSSGGGVVVFLLRKVLWRHHSATVMKDRAEVVREWARIRPESIRDRLELGLATCRFTFQVLTGAGPNRKGYMPFLGWYLDRPITVRSLGLRIEARAHSDDLHNTDRLHKPGVARWFRPRPGETVIDVGSHIGLYSLWAAKAGANVVAVEPDPQTFRALARNIEINGVANVVPLNVAVGDRNGTANLYEAGPWSSVNSLDSHWASRFGARITRVEPVKVLTLDQVLQEAGGGKVDWLLVDAEGAEVPVLRGGPRTLASCSRIIVEVEDESALECENILSRHGFSVKARLPEPGINSYWFVERVEGLHA